MKILVTLFTLIFTLNAIQAQRFSAGLFLGGANYQGDLVAKEVALKETNLAFGVFAQYSVTNKLSLRGNVFNGSIGGTDLGTRNAARGLSFSTNIFEGSMVANWDILGKARFDSKGTFTRAYTPYIFAGVGMVLFKPTVTGLSQNSPDSKAEYGSFQLTLPFGMGIKYDLTKQITLSVEGSTHLPFTDYLDGVSEEGNPGNHDWYSWGGITAAYWFGLPKSSESSTNSDGKKGAKFY
ncbi:MAG: hypothetical protein RLZZ292_4087 [Bacteroidota bacterium]|jgi:hypothetical protein